MRPTSGAIPEDEDEEDAEDREKLLEDADDGRGEENGDGTRRWLEDDSDEVDEANVEPADRNSGGSSPEPSS